MTAPSAGPTWTGTARPRRPVTSTFTPSQAIGRFIVSDSQPYLGTARGWRKLDMSTAEALYVHDVELRQRLVKRFLIVLVVAVVLTLVLTAVAV